MLADVHCSEKENNMNWELGERNYGISAALAYFSYLIEIMDSNNIFFSRPAKFNHLIYVLASSTFESKCGKM